MTELKITPLCSIVSEKWKTIQSFLSPFFLPLYLPFRFKNRFYPILIYLFLCVYTHPRAHATVCTQGPAGRSLFSPITTWALGGKLQSALAAGTFAHWAIPWTPSFQFLRLCNPRWPGTQDKTHSGLKLTVLRLQVCATLTSYVFSLAQHPFTNLTCIVAVVTVVCC